jgi:predicted outer membrane repeat protein
LTKGKATDGGAILISEQTLNISYCRFNNNQATFEGGAISVATLAGAAKVNIDNTTFSGNKAEDGGALHIGNNAVIKGVPAAAGGGCTEGNFAIGDR